MFSSRDALSGGCVSNDDANEPQPGLNRDLGSITIVPPPTIFFSGKGSIPGPQDSVRKIAEQHENE
jgi:hypothetical protein